MENFIIHRIVKDFILRVSVISLLPVQIFMYFLSNIVTVMKNANMFYSR